jgi:hypothetical protein
MATTKQRHLEADLVQKPYIRFLDNNFPLIRRVVAPITQLDVDYKRAHIKGAIRKAMGYQAGTADVLLLAARQGYKGFALEFKKPAEPGYVEYGAGGKTVKGKPAGSMSDEQKKWLSGLVREGWLVGKFEYVADAELMTKWYFAPLGCNKPVCFYKTCAEVMADVKSY